MSVGALTDHNQAQAYTQSKQVTQSVQGVSEQTDQKVQKLLDEGSSRVGDMARATAAVSRSDTGRVDIYV
ncbi:MAG: hypothetical protein HQL53_10155 [Magnetococcales bacterium]|nr:hypothetical protein [Magnetococcales bacterium]